MPIENDNLIEFTVTYEDTFFYSEEKNYPHIEIIKTVEDYNSFCVEYGFDQTKYEQDFFEDRYLLIVGLRTSNAAQKFKVKEINNYGDNLYAVKIEDENTDGAGAAVMGERYCFIELNDNIVITNLNQILIL